MSSRASEESTTSKLIDLLTHVALPCPYLSLVMMISSTSYSPRELYSVVANVPSYSAFLPFCTSSSVVSAAKIRPDEAFEVDAELKVAFMNFSEGYVSRVKGRPFESVEVSSLA